MMVKRTVSLSRRTHATLPNDDNEAVSSTVLVSCAHNTELIFHTREYLDIPNRGLEPHVARLSVDNLQQKTRRR